MNMTVSTEQLDAERSFVECMSAAMTLETLSVSLESLSGAIYKSDIACRSEDMTLESFESIMSSIGTYITDYDARKDDFIAFIKRVVKVIYDVFKKISAVIMDFFKSVFTNLGRMRRYLNQLKKENDKSIADERSGKIPLQDISRTIEVPLSDDLTMVEKGRTVFTKETVLNGTRAVERFFREHYTNAMDIINELHHHQLRFLEARLDGTAASKYNAVLLKYISREELSNMEHLPGGYRYQSRAVYVVKDRRDNLTNYVESFARVHTPSRRTEKRSMTILTRAECADLIDEMFSIISIVEKYEARHNEIVKKTKEISDQTGNIIAASDAGVWDSIKESHETVKALQNISRNHVKTLAEMDTMLLRYLRALSSLLRLSLHD